MRSIRWALHVNIDTQIPQFFDLLIFVGKSASCLGVSCCNSRLFANPPSLLLTYEPADKFCRSRPRFFFATEYTSRSRPKQQLLRHKGCSQRTATSGMNYCLRWLHGIVRNGAAAWNVAFMFCRGYRILRRQTPSMSPNTTMSTFPDL